MSLAKPLFDWKSVARVLFILAACFIFVAPLLVMIFGSFKTPTDLSRNPGGLPTIWTLENYRILFTTNRALVRGFFNSVYVTLAYIVVSLAMTAMAAYAFAKFRFWGKEVLFIVLLSTMMIPKQILIPPQYLIFARIGWLNTYRVQILADAANVFGVFMLRQYFENMPDSVLESARIDGARHLQIFARLVIPMSTPSLGALAILKFNMKWNDYLFPVMFIRDLAKAPFMVILPQLMGADGNELLVPWTLILAGCTFVSIPVILAFLSIQDKVMTSMTAGAVKE